MNPLMNPLWTAASFLLGRARCRGRAALDRDPESGALTLEWIVIAGLLVAAAITAAALFGTAITTWASRLTAGS
jgi:hypothetical protein